MRIFSKKAFAFKDPNVIDVVAEISGGKKTYIEVQPGSFTSVPDWVKNDAMFQWALSDGDIEILEDAKPMVSGVSIPAPSTEGEEEDPVADDEFSGLTNKQLYDKCVEAGIEVEPKKSRAYYIEKLTQ